MGDATRVLAVFAHPDDETYGPGGTLARLSAEGAQVRLITLTRGESATMGDSPLYSPELLADVRVRELECACRALGIADHRTFAFPDRGLAGVPSEELASPVAEAMGEFRPHLVITFHPEGISGHEDHRAASRVVTQLVRESCEASGVSTGHEEPGRIQPPRLAYYTVPDSMGAKVEWRRLYTVPDGSVTHAVEVGNYLTVKTTAAECHKTQRWMLERLSAVQGGLSELWKYEYFIVEGADRRGGPKPDLLDDG